MGGHQVHIQNLSEPDSTAVKKDVLVTFLIYFALIHALLKIKQFSVFIFKGMHVSHRSDPDARFPVNGYPNIDTQSCLCCLSKKSFPFLYSKLLYKLDLDTRY